MFVGAGCTNLSKMSVDIPPECTQGTNNFTNGTCFINESTKFTSGIYKLNFKNDSGALGLIRINANNVTLDCNGTTIDASGHNAIWVENLDGITIKNCNILNVNRGIVFNKVKNASLENNKVSNWVGAGIQLDNYTDAKLTNNTACNGDFIASKEYKPGKGFQCDTDNARAIITDDGDNIGTSVTCKSLVLKSCP